MSEETTITLKVLCEEHLYSPAKAHYGQMVDGFIDALEEFVREFVDDNSQMTPPGFQIEVKRED